MLRTLAGQGCGHSGMTAASRDGALRGGYAPDVDVDVRIERSATVAVPYARAKERMLDLEGTLRLFPKLARLTQLGERRYLWELEPIGFKPAGISHVVRYATDFSVDLDRGVTEWTPVAGEGNSLIRGRWVTVDHGDHIDITMSISGTIGDIRVPLAFRLAVPAFVRSVFTDLVEGFLARLAEKVSSGGVVR